MLQCTVMVDHEAYEHGPCGWQINTGMDTHVYGRCAHAWVHMCLTDIHGHGYMCLWQIWTRMKGIWTWRYGCNHGCMGLGSLIHMHRCNGVTMHMHGYTCVWQTCMGNGYMCLWQDMNMNERHMDTKKWLHGCMGLGSLIHMHGCNGVTMHMHGYTCVWQTCMGNGYMCLWQDMNMNERHMDTKKWLHGCMGLGSLIHMHGCNGVTMHMHGYTCVWQTCMGMGTCVYGRTWTWMKGIWTWRCGCMVVWDWVH